jgi:hypothetical protein
VGYVIRTYRPGDDERLLELWNRSYSRYGGLVARSIEYWRWTILARPGLTADRVLVLEDREQVLAYGVLWKDGEVLELAIDPSRRPSERRAMLRTLIKAMEERARADGCDMLSLLLPSSDGVLDKTLRAAGYVVGPWNAFSLGILNPQALIRQLLSRNPARLSAAVGGTFVIELKQENDTFLLQRRLRVTLGATVQVENISDVALAPADCLIAVSLGTLTEIIFCRVPVPALIAQSLIQISPAAKQRSASDLLNALAIDADWYTPRSDTF